MITLILEITSKETDISEYNGLLEAQDELIVICRDDNTIEAYNNAVKKADASSDILFLSDTVTIHDGFVKNMKECLYTAEKHAIVCAQEIDSIEDDKVKNFLPKYSMGKLPSSCCALIKRTAINNFGYLDTEFNTLLYALIDFHFRVNQFGFSTIISHHAMYFQKNRDSAVSYEKDRETLSSKYDYFETIEKQQSEHLAHPSIKFKELFANNSSRKKSILFDCIIMPPEYNGTTEYQLSLFESFYNLFKDKYDIFLHVTPVADEYFGLSKKFSNIVYPGMISGVFDLGFAPNQLMYLPFQFTLNKCCLKVVQTMYDIMMVRIDEHLGVNIKDVEMGVDLSDGIIYISNFSKNDFDAYFGLNKPTKVIYPASNLSHSQTSNYNLPFEEYFLIIGNHFKHKAIKEALQAVSQSEHNYIVVGSGNDEYIEKNIYGYRSGQLDSDFLSYLYAKSKAVIFPSQYEGFGLPIAIGLRNNKRVIVKNNELNNELLEHFQDFKDYFIFFDNFSQIVDAVNNIDFSEQLPFAEYKDSWDNVAIEVESFFEEIMNTEVDAEKLSKRWRIFNLFEEKHSQHTGQFRHLEKEYKKLSEQHNELGRQSHELSQINNELSRINSDLTRSFSYRLSQKVASCPPIRGLYLIFKKAYRTLRPHRS